jgi:hypothetical protein
VYGLAARGDIRGTPDSGAHEDGGTLNQTPIRKTDGVARKERRRGGPRLLCFANAYWFTA